MTGSISIKGTTFTFATIPRNPRWSSSHQGAAATRPFRVVNLETFVNALTDDEGYVFEGLLIHLIEAPYELTEEGEEPDTTAVVALSGEDGEWSVTIPGDHSTGIIGNMQSLAQRIYPYLDKGQVAVFETVGSVPQDVTLFYAIHAINDEGKTYTHGEQSLVEEILISLGSGDAARVNSTRLFEA